jgi:P27 family predicted phage terminase small subunit
VARTGRPPKPTELKRRTGNPGKRALPAKSETVALVPADGVPPVPMTLGQSGRAFWDRAWKAAQAWLSPDLDIVAVEAVCQLVDQVSAMRVQIASDGLLLSEPIVTPAGMVVGERLVNHPLLKELRAAEKQLQSWLSTLGFDPTARARLGLAEVKRQSALQQLLQVERGEAVDGEVVEILAD